MCPVRVSCKSVRKARQVRVSYKRVKPECPTEVSNKNGLARVSRKRVKSERPTRVSSKSVEKKSGK